MKLNIGNKIRCLRHEKDITQEEFAEFLGVACQSVSRWENSICYPDIELIPVIAEFFGVTVDSLMGVDEAVEKEKIAEYLDQFQEAVSQGRIDDCIAVARKGTAEYPNNFELLNKLRLQEGLRLTIARWGAGRSEEEKLIFDGEAPAEWRTVKLHCDMAAVFARLKRFDQMYEQLEEAARSARTFDNRPERRCVSSLLLGEMIREKTDFETADSRPLSEIMRDKWLAAEEFDGIDSLFVQKGDLS